MLIVGAIKLLPPRRRCSLGPVLGLLASLLLSIDLAADNAAAPPLVLSSIRPLHLIVLAVAGDRVDSRALLGLRASPHDFVLRPSDVRLIVSARQLFWIGPMLERPLNELLQRLPERPPALALLPDAAMTADPHLWLDPRQATAMARTIVATLAAQGILDATQQQSRLAEFATLMQATERDINTELADVQQVPFVAMHDAWGHFVRRFKLNQVAVLAVDAEHQGGARALAGMRHQVHESGAVCLLHEPFANPRQVAAVTEGTTLRALELDTLAVSAPDTAHGYAEFLKNMAHTLAECLRQPPQATTTEPKS